MCKFTSKWGSRCRGYGTALCRTAFGASSAYLLTLLRSVAFREQGRALHLIKLMDEGGVKVHRELYQEDAREYQNLAT